MHAGRRAQSVFELIRGLSAALEKSQVAQLGANAVQGYFGGRAAVLVADESDRLVMPVEIPSGFDPSAANRAFCQGQSIGLATAMLPAHCWRYLPLKAPRRVSGVLALKPEKPRGLSNPRQAQQLDTLARQIAIALERAHYVDVAQQAVVEMESERLRNALLAAISHDVRTPLTALIALAESLQSQLGAAECHQAEIARAIVAQARELNALTANLLDMTRLEGGIAGGPIKLRREWHSVEEMVGAAIRAGRPGLGEIAVKTDVPADLPLVDLDAVLIERVLVNLLENAAKYGASPIVVGARSTPGSLVLTVRDHGLGLPAALAGCGHTLFDRFTRGRAESAKPGTGLGLAICKSIVNAHGGEITAVNARDGGAEFSVRLPRRLPPAAVDTTA